MTNDEVRKIENAQANLGKAMDRVKAALELVHEGHVSIGAIREADRHVRTAFKELDELFLRCDDCRRREARSNLSTLGLCPSCK